MDDSVTIGCEITNSDPQAELGLEIWIDQYRVLDVAHVQNLVEFSQRISVSNGNHTIRFVLKGKTATHTQLGPNGEIVKDALLQIKNICFEQVPVDKVFFEQSQYQHDLNGTGAMIQTKFYGAMGFNGSVEMKFSTPIYLWMLENM